MTISRSAEKGNNNLIRLQINNNIIILYSYTELRGNAVCDLLHSTCYLVMFNYITIESLLHGSICSYKMLNKNSLTVKKCEANQMPQWL